LIVLLRHIESGKIIVVANSHFEPSEKVDYVKYAQAFWMLKCIQDFYTTHQLKEEIPLIITGDLNSVPNGSALHLLMGHQYDPTKVQEDMDPKL